MSPQLSYSIATSLACDLVWKLLTDIEQWTKCSDVYADLRWSGFPWTAGSCMLGKLNYPVPLTLRYVVQTYDPPRFIRYIVHSTDAGFAAELAIGLEQFKKQTSIVVSAFTAGELAISFPGGSIGFLKMLIEQWFQDFAQFCDQHAQKSARPR